MYTLPTSNYLKRSLLVNHQRIVPAVPDSPSHRERILAELRQTGASRFGMWKLASRYLPNVIHEHEHIGGVVYGRNDKDGAVMLIATNRRIIYLDKKPLFVNEDEVTYLMVSGLDYGQAGFGCTVKLHTRIKDYVVHTLNKKAARQFLSYIEEHRLEFTLENEVVT